MQFVFIPVFIHTFIGIIHVFLAKFNLALQVFPLIYVHKFYSHGACYIQ